MGIHDIEKVKKYFDEYTYSSLHDYFGSREESKILDKDKFPEYFSTRHEIDKELIDWLNYGDPSQSDKGSPFADVYKG